MCSLAGSQKAGNESGCIRTERIMQDPHVAIDQIAGVERRPSNSSEVCKAAKSKSTAFSATI